MLHILFGVYAVSGRERVAPNDGGTANFVFVFTVFVGKMLILCHLHKYEEKTGTHSAIKIRRFFCYFIFVIYFCTTRNRESCCFSSAVEHFLGKEEVPGSSPGNSSKKRGCLTNRRHPLYLFLFVLLSRNHFRICDSRKIKNLPAPLQPHAQCRRHS